MLQHRRSPGEAEEGWDGGTQAQSRAKHFQALRKIPVARAENYQPVGSFLTIVMVRSSTAR